MNALGEIAGAVDVGSCAGEMGWKDGDALVVTAPVAVALVGKDEGIWNGTLAEVLDLDGIGVGGFGSVQRFLCEDFTDCSDTADVILALEL